MTRKSLLLFVATSIIWGSSFLFIRLAVEHMPPAWVVTLGIVNTGIAYWLFYLLIDEAGAAMASVITYVMPVVALFLGVGLLGERLTAGAVAGLVLIALGAWLATSRKKHSGSDPAADANEAAAERSTQRDPNR
jgi:drug/metabolite transporter (DMT)-like permease